jgi:hypothetical protein
MVSIVKSARRAAPFLVTAVLALSACGGSTSPDLGVPESSLHFLSPNSGAPALVSDTVRFYAVVGQDRLASLYYQPVNGLGDSVQFLAFDVPANARIQQPDGTPVADGDSVLITVALADSSRLIVAFAPSGLTFSGQPAQLTLSFAEADSSLSASSKSSLALWRQEQPGDRWHKVSSTVHQGALTVSGSVDGFTVYATAY